MLCTQNLPLYVYNNFCPPNKKILRYFRHKVSNLWCVYDRPIYTKFIEGMFSTFFTRDSKLLWCLCVSYLVCSAYIINYLLRKLPGLYFSTNFLGSKLLWWWYLRYQDQCKEHFQGAVYCEWERYLPDKRSFFWKLPSLFS